MTSGVVFLAGMAGSGISAPTQKTLTGDVFTPPRNSWAKTTGGSDGQIVRVTSLNPSGPGSLKEALEQTFPRMIVFEVGGVIDLAGTSIKVRSPHVTLAGQTAPSPGITLIRGKISISTHDVIVQHISFRPGTGGNAPGSGWEADGLTLYGAHDVIVDHCSFSWATDENLSVSGTRFDGPAGLGRAPGAPYNVMISNSIIAEGLMNATHKKGGHSKGLLVHDNAENILVTGNIFISNHDRNALFKGGSTGAFVNNTVVNPGVTAVSYNLSRREWQGQPMKTGRLSVIGNVYAPGSDTRKNLPFLRILGEGPVEVYARDNAQVTANGRLDALDGTAVEPSALKQELRTAYVPTGIHPLSAVLAWTLNFETAGARPWDRDAIDVQILARARNGATRIIDSEQQVGGYPERKPAKRVFRRADWILPDMAPRPGFTLD
jgi:pectate lyase